MLTKKRFALNRIISPAMPLAEFFKFTASLSLAKVELRNDLPGKPKVPDIIDGMKPAELLNIARGEGVSIITINALQKFNLPEKRAVCVEELKQMLELAAAIECKAIVLCPNNEANDKRKPAEKYRDTVAALIDYGPLFAEYNVLGYVEPLGFGISSLASLVAAAHAIDESGFACYRALLDSFHHYIGPDSIAMFGMGGFGASYHALYTGLVHISGVEDNIAAADYRDGHRVLVTQADRMGNKELIACMDSLGYSGDYSYEPFSPAVQKLSAAELKSAVTESLKFIGVKG